MSGSGHQSGRSIVKEIQDTLRLHFKGAQCHDLEISTLSARDVEADLNVPTSGYGGSIAMQHAVVATMNLDWPVETFATPSTITARLNETSGTIATISVYGMPVITNTSTSALGGEVALTSHNTQASSLPIQPLEVTAKPWRRALWQIKTQARHRFRMAFTVFQKPVWYRVSLLNAIQVFKRPGHQSLGPICRQPVSAYRFSTTARRIFRERLAQKAGVAVDQVQIVQIYDRLILGLFEQFATAENGEIRCYPKVANRLQRSAPTASQQPVYFIRGETLQVPKQKIQTVVPMSELEG